MTYLPPDQPEGASGFAPAFPEPPTQQIPGPVPEPAVEPDTGRHWLRDPLSMALILVIVAALGLAGILGGEMYARHQADTIVAKAVSCVVQDSARVSFGARPFLIQHFTHNYREMVVETAGNRIREAKGMKLRLSLDDIRLNQTADSAGTLGSLDADVTWSTEGIQQTVSGIIPFLGGLVSGVSTDPSAGTLELQGPLGTVTVAPTVADNDLSLQVLKVTGLGFTLLPGAHPIVPVMLGDAVLAQDMAADLGIRKVRFDGEKKNLPLDNNNPSLVRDQNKCILCGRCIKACSDRQGVDVYSFAKGG